MTEFMLRLNPMQDKLPCFLIVLVWLLQMPMQLSWVGELVKKNTTNVNLLGHLYALFFDVLREKGVSFSIIGKILQLFCDIFVQYFIWKPIAKISKIW